MGGYFKFVGYARKFIVNHFANKTRGSLWVCLFQLLDVQGVSWALDSLLSRACPVTWHTAHMGALPPWRMSSAWPASPDFRGKVSVTPSHQCWGQNSWFSCLPQSWKGHCLFLQSPLQTNWLKLEKEKKKNNHSRFRSDFMPCGFLLVIRMLATICEEK